jgi:extracellular matrix regulatory protein A
MSIQFVDIGFSNYVEASKIMTINRPESSPVKRLVLNAKETNHFVDLTQGKKTRSIITQKSESGLVVTASAVQTATIIDRIRRAQQSQEIVEKVSGDIVEITSVV